MADDYSPPLSTYEEDMGPPVGADPYKPPPPEPYHGDVLAPDRGAPDPFRDRALSAFDASQRAIGGAVESMDKEAKIAEEKSGALAPLRQRIADYAARPLPEPPAPQAPPPVPQNKKNQEDWIMAAGLLGALAGATTRRHATNALAAFTGTLQGANEGNKQAFDQNMKVWEAENKRVLEANNMALNHYRDIMENRKLNLEQMSVELQMAAAQYDDKAMATAARSKNFQTIAGLYDKQFQALGQYEKSSREITTNNAIRKQQEFERMAKEYANSESGTERAKLIASYQLPPLPTTQRTGYEGARNVALMDKVIEINPDYKAQMYGVRKIEMETASRVARAADTIEGTTKAREHQRTAIAFDVGVEARSVRSLNVAIDHLSALEGLAKALDSGDIRALNAFNNYVSRQLGYAEVTNLDAAKSIVSQEVVKAVVNNGGSATERLEAQENMANAASPAQWAGVIATEKRLMAGQMAGLRRQYESGTGRTDFEDRLEPRTIKELKAHSAASGEAAATATSESGILVEAHDALNKGVPPDAVMKRLQERGIDPSKLFDPTGFGAGM